MEEGELWRGRKIEKIEQPGMTWYLPEYIDYTESNTMLVRRIEVDGDRVLFYGDDENYHIIGSKKDKVKVGDDIKYEEGGYNFGWLKKEMKSE